MRTATRLIGLAALVAVNVSCGDVVRQGSSPVFLVIDSLRGPTGTEQFQSDVITNRTTPDPCSVATPCPTVTSDNATAFLRAPLKDPGATGGLSPTTNNEVTINSIHVEFSRADGLKKPGVDVPFAFDSALTGTIRPGNTLQLTFELVRTVAKQEAPLVQLRTSSNVLSVIAKITFYGVDRVGNNIQTTGQMQIEFGNFPG